MTNGDTRIPQASFHALMERIKVAAPSIPFILQIGAMDGVRFDLVSPHVLKGGWRALLIEPVPDMFQALTATYANQPTVTLANCAIAPHKGTLTMRRIRPEAVAEGIVPEQALGLSTAADSHGHLNSGEVQKKYPALRPEHFETFDVPCLPLADLLRQCGVDAIDVVVIDTEGADWMIAQQLDVARYRPSMICLEHSSLADGEKIACLNHFIGHGYVPSMCSEDMENFLFVRPDAQALLQDGAPPRKTTS